MARKPKSPPIPRDTVIEKYGKRLDTVGRDEERLREILLDLKADKDVRKLELVSIASHYVDARLTSQTKMSALREIEREFIRRVRFDSERESALK
jgi:hypothetical protein